MSRWELARSPHSEPSEGEHMQNRYRRELLVGIVLLWAVGGVAGRALALTFKEFPVSTPIGVPYSIDNPAAITTGPDGALWFTETPNNSIGSTTTAGVIAVFLPPSTEHTRVATGLATAMTTSP